MRKSGLHQVKLPLIWRIFVIPGTFNGLWLMAHSVINSILLLLQQISLLSDNSYITGSVSFWIFY